MKHNRTELFERYDQIKTDMSQVKPKAFNGFVEPTRDKRPKVIDGESLLQFLVEAVSQNPNLEQSSIENTDPACWFNWGVQVDFWCPLYNQCFPNSFFSENHTSTYKFK